MTRTYKWQNKENKYFTHNGNFNEDKNHVKKNGAGRGNWGTETDDLHELMNTGEVAKLYNRGRRGSNSQKQEARFDAISKSDPTENAIEN